MNENNCDLLPFVTQSYFASLIQNSIKIHRRSLCNIADLSNSEESFHSLTHLYHLDTFELIFFFFNHSYGYLSPLDVCEHLECVFL